jgi:hypothetical protein
MRPSLGQNSPDNSPTRVDLPAPLVPINAWIEPLASASDTPSTAFKPR